jgi:hypothetical protein
MSFLERGILRAKAGVIKLGADVDLVRRAANRFDVDDAAQISGTANITGATRIGGVLTAASTLTATGAITATGGIATLPGTPFCIPYGTAVPTITANGDIRVYHKSTDHIPRLVFQSNGTPYVIALPTATHGTITVTVNSIP